MAAIQSLPRSRRRGSARFFSLVPFIFSVRFAAGCVAGIALAGGYASMHPPKLAPCPLLPPVVVSKAPEPVPEVHTYAGETSFIAREFTEVQSLPKKSKKPAPFMIARFDRAGKCMQIKERSRFYFLTDGCLVFGSKVKDRKQFTQEYARTKAEESHWRAQESIAKSLL